MGVAVGVCQAGDVPVGVLEGVEAFVERAVGRGRSVAVAEDQVVDVERAPRYPDIPKTRLIDVRFVTGLLPMMKRRCQVTASIHKCVTIMSASSNLIAMLHR